MTMRYLALDLGDRRIGIALSDGVLARPLEMFYRSSRAADFAHIEMLVHQHQVTTLVIGLPLNMDGTEGSQAAWVRNYGAALAQAVELPAIFWDERLTSVEAEEVLRTQGRHPEKHLIDAIAAAVILQSYLDHLGNEGQKP